MAGFDLQKLIFDLQATALDVERWPRVLMDVSQAVAGAGAVLFSADRRIPEPLASPDLADAMADYARDGWYLKG